jgi:hypothetical protein
MNKMTLGELKIVVLKSMRGNEQDFVIANISEYEEILEYSDIINNIIPCINRGLIRISKSEVIPLKSKEINLLTPYTKKTEKWTKYSITALSSDMEARNIKTISKENNESEAIDENIEYTTYENTLILPTIEEYYLSYTNLASFPSEGDSDYRYIDLATEKVYNYENDTYVELTSDEYEEYNEDYLDEFNRYTIVYEPRLSMLTEATDNTYDLVDDLGITEELSQMLVYYVKAELLEEDNPSISLLNRNMFESYLGQFKREKKRYKQNKVKETEYN